MSDRQPPAKPKKKTDTATWVITGIIVVVLVLTLIFAIRALTVPIAPKVTTPPAQTAGSPTPSPTQESTPLPSDAASQVLITDATVGTCFDQQATVDSGGKYVDPIDCTEKHDSEVFYSAPLDSATYPDEAGWKQAVLDNCHTAFKTYTGVTFGSNSWQMFYIYPATQAQWDGGDHMLLCYTMDPIGGQRVGSVAKK